MDNFFDNKPIFGMIHLHPGPRGVVDRAIKEIGILEREGVDGAIIENYHGTSGDIMEVMMELGKSKIKIGFNVLPNDFKRAYNFASYFNADFIQLDYVSGSYQRCEDFDKRGFMTYRKRFPNIKVLGGVWPKYYYPNKGSVLEDDIKEAIKLTDAIVVTGSGAGKETPLEKVSKFRELCGDHPLIIGSGLDSSNVTDQLEVANGGIVGSAFKMDKKTTKMIYSSLVEDFMKSKNKSHGVS